MTGYSEVLDTFIADISSMIDAGLPVEDLLSKGSSLLERVVRSKDVLPEELRVTSPGGRGGNHATYKLHVAPSGLSVTAVVWGPGDRVGPHDHRTWGLIGVLENGIKESRYRRLDDRSDPSFARLEREKREIVKAGSVSVLVPGIDEIHEMNNPSDRPTVEIHVYGRDLKGLERSLFDPETGKVTTLITRRYDNE